MGILPNKRLGLPQTMKERTGAGVLAFITNHGYLDNPTFRGMRQSLINAFSDIYVLNLHGSSKKQEKAPSGEQDENVFDIQQGVAIGIFVREPDRHGPACVHYADLWGSRGRKYEWLFEHDVSATTFDNLKPASPSYFLVPREDSVRKEYEASRKITEILRENVTGIVTARDDFVLDLDKAALLERMSEFRSKTLSDEEIREKYFQRKSSSKYPPGDTRGWKLPEARERVRADKMWKERVIPSLYRPFDSRFLYYVPWMVDWPRPEVMGHMLMGSNVGLVWTRPMSPNYEFSTIATRDVTDQCAVGNKSAGAGISYLGPLYIYTHKRSSRHGQKELDIEGTSWPRGSNGRTANLDPQFVADFGKRLGLAFVPEGKGDLKKTFGPEDVFNYIYAVFHSPTYRNRYAEFLKSDFPRVPLTSNLKLFRLLCILGGELVALQLLESPTLAGPIALYPIKGSNFVAKGFPKYMPAGEREPGTGKPLKAGRVYINRRDPQQETEGQYFEGVPQEVWDFHIGGYQVCEKWLKDRRERVLTYEDLEHYCKTVTALNETISLMREIDAVIPAWPLP